MYIDGNFQPPNEVADKFLIVPYPFLHTEHMIKCWSSLRFSYQKQILFWVIRINVKLRNTWRLSTFAVLFRCLDCCPSMRFRCPTCISAKATFPSFSSWQNRSKPNEFDLSILLPFKQTPWPFAVLIFLFLIDTCVSYGSYHRHSLEVGNEFSQLFFSYISCVTNLTSFTLIFYI